EMGPLCEVPDKGAMTRALKRAADERRAASAAFLKELNARLRKKARAKGASPPAKKAPAKKASPPAKKVPAKKASPPAKKVPAKKGPAAKKVSAKKKAARKR